jgi:alpha-mannosidase
MNKSKIFILFSSVYLIVYPVLGRELSRHGDESIESGDRQSGITPDILEALEACRNGYFKNGVIHFITSSHQDNAWMDSPQKCMADRDSLVLTPALEILKKFPDYHYSVEDALMLHEYLSLHPDRLAQIQRLTLQGRLEWGATYIQPYEGMYPGESLIRQLYFGRKWLQKMIPGYDPRVAWNLDVPDRALQMPQILAKSGVPYMLISRHGKGLFHWMSPDGSSVGVFSPGHYHWASEFLRKDTRTALTELPKVLQEWQPFYQKYGIPPHIPILFSTDMSAPRDFSEFFKMWNQHSDPKEGGGVPVLQYDVSEPALSCIFQESDSLPVIQGERPNVWVYIHGPTHHKTISASREAARLLTAAEIFNTVNAALQHDFKNYPQQALSQAWESHIYPDHGWGGKNGEITDQVFYDKSEFAREQARRLLFDALNAISSRVRTVELFGEPVIVFNDLSWEREDPVSVDLEFSPGRVHAVKVLDDRGTAVAAQLSNTLLYSDTSIQKTTVSFCAPFVPSIGFTTFYLKYLMNNTEIFTAAKPVHSFENKFFRISFAPGGIGQVYDKEVQVDLFRTDKFYAGELFTMRSVGEDAGEFNAIQQPTMEDFDKVSLYQPQWNQVEDGAVYARFELRQKMPHVDYIQKVTVYKTLKRIDFDVDLLNWDGTEYREFRLAFPLNMENGHVTYEVPFGKSTVGVDEIKGPAGERYVQPCSEVHPREILDWIGASDDQKGVTFGSSVSVWDFTDVTDNPVSYPLLQPLLLASRKSCHQEGNWYLQKGDHSYHFSLFAHHAGWQEGYHQAEQANHPLYAVQVSAHDKIIEKDLPSVQCFCSCSEPNVIISTIKKSEDEESILLRAFEMEGKDTDVFVEWFQPVSALAETNLIEEDAQPIPLENDLLQLNVGHHAIKSVKFK